MATPKVELESSYDVVIVGAGPAGAGVAKALTNSGLRTVIIDKEVLPRDKMCTGILFPSATKIVQNDFGILPEAIFCGRPNVKANRFYIVNGSDVVESPWIEMDPGEGLPDCGWNVDRAEFDYWLCKQSDAHLVGNCSFEGHQIESGNIVVKVKHDGKQKTVQTKFLVGADGMSSRVRKSVAPEFEESVGYYAVYEEWYVGSIDLEEEFMYFFLDAEITDFFATVFSKDERIFVTTTVKQGKSAKQYLWKFRDLLIEKHGLNVKEIAGTRGCMKNDMTGKRTYSFGKGNVLIAGDANGVIEGINSAMNTGKTAGQAILESVKTGVPALECYVGKELLLAEQARGEMMLTGLESKLGYNLYCRA